jgi:hypothetical protein
MPKTLLTDKVAYRIAKHVERGDRFYIACALEHIAEDTGRNWLSEGRKWPNTPQGRFAKACAAASAKAEQRAQARIQKGIKQSWVAAAWWLTHSGSTKGVWAARDPAANTRVNVNIVEQIRGRVTGMSGHVLEAEFSRLDQNARMIGEGTPPGD